jgi:hypothetical protein
MEYSKEIESSEWFFHKPYFKVGFVEKPFRTLRWIYRKLTEACRTKAKRKNNKGIIGITSTIGSKIA